MRTIEKLVPIAMGIGDTYTVDIRLDGREVARTYRVANILHYGPPGYRWVELEIVADRPLAPLGPRCRDCGAVGPVDNRGFGFACGCASE